MSTNLVDKPSDYHMGSVATNTTSGVMLLLMDYSSTKLCIWCQSGKPTSGQSAIIYYI